MSLKIVNQEPSNFFEKEIYRICTSLPIDGVLAANAFLPNNENGLDEQDIVIVSDHTIFTIDAKAYEPGEYRGGLNTPLEYQKKIGSGFAPLNSRLSKPLSTAAYKTKIIVTTLNKIIKQKKRIQTKFIPNGLKIVSIIVVPDHAHFVGEILEKNEGIAKAHCSYRVLTKSQLKDFLINEFLSPLHSSKPELRTALLNELKKVTGDFLNKYHQISEPLINNVKFLEKIKSSNDDIPFEYWRGIKDGEHVFIKKLRKYPWRENSNLLFREIALQTRALKKARFPRIVGLLDTYDFPDCYVMIYEWYENEGTLEDAIRNLYGLSENDALCFFRELANTVNNLHKNPGREKVILRSLEPRKILLKTWIGEIKWGEIDYLITGFDNAIVQGRSSIGTEGKSPYEAPELKTLSIDRNRGKSTVDIYSLGKIFYFLLTGRAPEFDNSLDFEGVNSCFTNIISNCIAHNPKDRYQSIEDVVKELPEVL